MGGRLRGGEIGVDWYRWGGRWGVGWGIEGGVVADVV